MRKKRYLLPALCLLTGTVLTFGGCEKQDEKQEWKEAAGLEKTESPKGLYQAALEEDTLIVYTVSTRITKVKESFEKEYPGLFVEVRDLRSPNLVEAVKANFDNGGSDCDVVICNDNSGNFYEKLVKTGAVVSYLPEDIRVHMSEPGENESMTFLKEAELLFYNSELYDSCPITNVWELTEEKYQGKIYVPNPLRSFSTYALFASILDQSEELLQAYEEWAGKSFVSEENQTAAETFLAKLSKNAVYTNSSDEVYEALGTTGGKAHFGIMVSSKLRMKEYGYNFEPAYDVTPFCGCQTSFACMMATGSQNVNTAKLFIRFLLGEQDGSGKGYQPFLTQGTWPVRDDVAGQSEVALEEMNLLIPDQKKLCEESDKHLTFFESIIKDK